MKYQLILQWSVASLKDYDQLLEIENILIERLDDGSDIDGHDVGSGEMNIFIHTNDPKATFESIKSIIGSYDFWIDARIAYREVPGDKYTMLWPSGLHEFKVI